MTDERSGPKKRATTAKATGEPNPMAAIIVDDAGADRPAGKKKRRKVDADAAQAGGLAATTTTAADDLIEPVGAAGRDRGPEPDTGADDGRAPQSAPGAALGGTPEGREGGRGGIPLPFTGMRIPVPHLPVPSQHDVIVGAVRVSNVVRENTPSGDQLLYYGGLGALAAFGVVDWPVAAAIGAGVWIARRHGREHREAEVRKPRETDAHNQRGASSAPPERDAAPSEADTREHAMTP
jgi:hypothetical protein